MDAAKNDQTAEVAKLLALPNRMEFINKGDSVRAALPHVRDPHASESDERGWGSFHWAGLGLQQSEHEGPVRGAPRAGGL